MLTTKTHKQTKSRVYCELTRVSSRGGEEAFLKVAIHVLKAALSTEFWQRGSPLVIPWEITECFRFPDSTESSGRCILFLSCIVL